MPHDEKKRDRKPKKSEKAAKAFAKKSSIAHDPGGSYTGRPVEKGDKPVQDADDL